MNDKNPRALGLSLPVIVGLALLAVPRVILHDLDVIQEGTLVNMLFVFVPPLVWVAVAVLRRVPNAFLTLLVVGIVYGVFLALGHQLLWNLSWGEDAPSLGGNLADLPPLAEAVVIRGFAVVSSLVTGTVVGALSGLVALALDRLTRPRAKA
ncbi:hypothetical protein DFP74_0323 [Nocardiopsis sp. Huas11]|uniref:hypothetical protein n=1 Tax=Nocardiopsis sp. Huas11 TaxID=2183912 RepID=UPI000EAE6FA7|nr:hypothetical protein [Nocardiopsis sp. Huas11]RKS04750.1 hypothetical protein DFP74_0323 [Nocardiopsis sp. Huas11]